MPTTTFYTIDEGALTRYVPGGESLAVIRAGNGTSVDSTSNPLYTQLAILTPPSTWAVIKRLAECFDTSSLGADTISAADIAWYASAAFGPTVIDQNSESDLDVYVTGFSSTPATPFAVADYQKTANVVFGHAAEPGSAGYFSITLDANGIAAINGAGNTYLMARNSADALNTFTGTPTGSTYQIMASISGGNPAQYCALTVTHSGAAPAGGPGILMGGAML